MDGRTVVSAATNGGQAGDVPAARLTAGGAAGGGPRAARGAPATITAGIICRYVVLSPKAKLSLSGLRSGVLRLRSRVTVKGVVAPAALAGDKVTLQAQAARGTLGQGRDHLVHHPRRGRVQLAVSPRQEGLVPRARDDGQDGDASGHHDELAHVQGEVGVLRVRALGRRWNNSRCSRRRSRPTAASSAAPWRSTATRPW